MTSETRLRRTTPAERMARVEKMRLHAWLYAFAVVSTLLVVALVVFNRMTPGTWLLVGLWIPTTVAWSLEAMYYVEAHS